MAIIRPGKLPLMIRLATNGHVPWLPALLAADRKQIRLAIMISHEEHWPASEIAAPGLPVVMIVLDDPPGGKRARGPLGWQCAGALQGRAKHVILDAGPGSDAVYNAAVKMALETGFCAVIETDILMLPDWDDYLSLPLSKTVH